MRTQEWMSRLSRGLLGCGAVAVALAAPGCKTLNERYIALEVWKYEKCFGHLPPGFVLVEAAIDEIAQAAAGLRTPPAERHLGADQRCRGDARTGCRAADTR